ncbi:MAG TPA: transcriptional repressor [Candidatus Acidoferrales bacterium]|nr:transcriptional repressor [Candidatus Acidoferrales bacterium]
MTNRQKPETGIPSPARSSGPESEVHVGVGKRLAAIRQRYTVGRRLLVEALIDAGRPLTVTEIVDLRPALPPSTAYRNLAVLEQATVVRRVQLSGEFARYELSEELTRHHHHLVCVDCGSVVDVTAPAGLEADVTATAKEVADALGFRLESHRLDLIGHCQACS